MKGDYHRYLAEFKTSAEMKEAAERTLFAYKTAQDIAISELAPTHHIILELALKFSIFYYEISNSPDRACALAFDEEITESKKIFLEIDLISPWRTILLVCVAFHAQVMKPGE